MCHEKTGGEQEPCKDAEEVPEVIHVGEEAQYGVAGSADGDTNHHPHMIGEVLPVEQQVRSRTT